MTDNIINAVTSDEYEKLKEKTKSYITSTETNINNKIKKCPVNGNSKYLIESFMIIGFDYNKLNELLSEKELINKINQQLIKDKCEDESNDFLGGVNIKPEFNIISINLEPIILNKISSTEKENIDVDFELIKTLLFPEQPKFYWKLEENDNRFSRNTSYTSGKTILNSFESDNAKMDDIREKRNIRLPSSYNIVFALNNLIDNQKSKKASKNYLAHIFYSKFDERIEIKNKTCSIYYPSIFLIQSEYPYYSNYFKICKKIKTKMRKLTRMPIEILLYNLVKFTPSPIFNNIALNIESHCNILETRLDTYKLDGIEEEKNEDNEEEKSKGDNIINKNSLTKINSFLYESSDNIPSTTKNNIINNSNISNNNISSPNKHLDESIGLYESGKNNNFLDAIKETSIDNISNNDSKNNSSNNESNNKDNIIKSISNNNISYISKSIYNNINNNNLNLSNDINSEKLKNRKNDLIISPLRNTENKRFKKSYSTSLTEPNNCYPRISSVSPNYQLYKQKLKYGFNNSSSKSISVFEDNSNSDIIFEQLSGYPLIQYNLYRILFEKLESFRLVQIYIESILENDIFIFENNIEHLSLLINSIINLSFPLELESIYYWHSVCISYDELLAGVTNFVGGFTKILGINKEYDEKNFLSKYKEDSNQILIVDLKEKELKYLDSYKGKISVNEKLKKFVKYIKEVCKNEKQYKTSFEKYIKELFNELDKIEKDNQKFLKYGYFDYNEDIKKCNRKIQEIFLEFNTKICFYLYKNIYLSSPGDIQSNNNTNENEEKINGLALFFDRTIENPKELTKEQEFINDLKGTTKCSSIVNFFKNFKALDSYKVPLCFVEEYLSILFIFDNLHIKFLDLIDSIYFSEQSKETIDFFDFNLNFYDKYVNNIYDEIKVLYDKNTIKPRISATKKKENFVNIISFSYKEIELNEELIKKYENILNDMDVTEYDENFGLYKEIIDKTDFSYVRWDSIEKTIEDSIICFDSYKINLYSMILVISITIKLFDTSEYESIFTDIICNLFTEKMLRKYYIYFYDIIYRILQENLMEENYSVANELLMRYFPFVNFIKSRDENIIVPNEALFNILLKFTCIDSNVFCDIASKENNNKNNDNDHKNVISITKFSNKSEENNLNDKNNINNNNNGKINIKINDNFSDDDNIPENGSDDNSSKISKIISDKSINNNTFKKLRKVPKKHYKLSNEKDDVLRANFRKYFFVSKNYDRRGIINQNNIRKCILYNNSNIICDNEGANRNSINNKNNKNNNSINNNNNKEIRFRITFIETKKKRKQFKLLWPKDVLKRLLKEYKKFSINLDLDVLDYDIVLECLANLIFYMNIGEGKSKMCLILGKIFLIINEIYNYKNNYS